jgi:hypothetical protein
VDDLSKMMVRPMLDSRVLVTFAGQLMKASKPAEEHWGI